MPILQLAPCCKNYIWGGSKLKTMFHKACEGEILAETWELSCHPDGESIITGGPYDSMTLSAYIRRHGTILLGSNCDRYKEFPVLIKLIDAKEKLSVQVHPDDVYAIKTEGQAGKTEMWYIVEADDGASVYFGFSKEITKDELRSRIEDGTVLDVLNSVPVKKGDVLLIEAGTVHAVGAGILIAEIQQNSNVTYRLYDYGRQTPDGKPRELHIDKALAVAHLTPPAKAHDYGAHLVSCGWFVVDMIDADIWYSAEASAASFHHLLILDGEGSIFDSSGRVSFRKGDSLFICAGSGTYTIVGRCRALRTTIPEQ